jgi:propanol-preferring alcohol dehydrogenase
MLAMQLLAPWSVDENDPLVVSELPEPEPGPGQILLAVRACGVCHTDLHTVEGELALPHLPLTPGHQVVGEVKALGKGVTRFQVGDRVGVAWVHTTCGVCRFCRCGQENLCEQAQFTGLHAPGGYAGAMLAAADFAFALPAGFADEQAAPLLCAGVIGYRALRLSQVQPGQRLGLFGFGASAHLAIQVARHRGCEVFVFTRSAAHQEHAAALGALWTGAPQEAPPFKLDAAINFTPSGAVTLDALRVLERGGTVAMAGIHSSPIPEFDYHLLYGERQLRSVTNATRQDAEELLALAAEIPLHTDVEVFTLLEANQVLRRLKRSQITGAAVLQCS